MFELQQKGPLQYAIIAVILIVALFQARSCVAEKRDSARWPSTSGRIVDSYVETRVNNIRDNTRSYVEYTVTVKYEYTVSDHHFIGTRITVQPNVYNSKSGAEAERRRYLEGQQVEVFYNPSK